MRKQSQKLVANQYWLIGCLALIVGTFLASSNVASAQGLSRIHKDDGSAYLEMQRADKAAGDYHNGDLLICSDCHVMHGSMQHNYEGTTSGVGNIASFPWSTTPSPSLLKFADPVDLCVSCHDGVAGIPDVIMGDINGLTERSGGFFDEVDVLNPRGHNLGRGLDNSGSNLCLRCHFGGDFATASVTCLDCHNTHGNGNPRNLQWASDPEGTPPLGLFVASGASGMSRYERANVAYGTTNDLSLREPTNMCTDCHHTLTGSYTDQDLNGIHEKHPSYDSERGFPNDIDQGLVRGTTNPAHWVAGTGQGFDGTERVPYVNEGGTDYATAHVIDSSTNGVLCFSCHKAHGSASAFGLVWTINGGIDNKGCDQCHLGEGR